jgi:hypothetical protein
MATFEQTLNISGIENEIAIFESFRLTAMKLGLAQAESQLSQEVTIRRQAIVRLKTEGK